MLLEQTSIMITFLLLAISAAVVAGDCNRPECDPSHEPVPNIFTAMTGYNIFNGNPFAQGKNVLKDPGFNNMEYIFLPTVKNEKDRYGLDDGLTVRSISSFAASLESEVIKNIKDYREALEKEMASGSKMATNLDYDVKVTVPVKGVKAEVGTKVPPLVSAAFGSNSAFRTNEKFFRSKTGILVIAKAHCIIYTVKVSQTKPPKFHPSFIKMLKELQKANDASDHEKNAKLKKLIENFGTHYLINVDMGARIAITKRFDREEVLKSTEEELQKCTEGRLNAIFGLINRQSSSCEKISKSKHASWSKEYDREYITSFGSRPDKDLMSWAKQDFNTPIPVQMTLDPIVNLFRDDFMEDIKDGDEKVEIDYKAILQWLLPKYLSYCQDHKSEMNIGSCDPIDLQPKRCGLNDDCDIEQTCKNVKSNGYECIDPERTYKVTTITSNIHYAGTNSDVWIMLVDTNSRASEGFYLDNSEDNFEVGKTDKFTIKTRKRLGDLRNIILVVGEKESSPGWHLHEVQVKDETRDRNYIFHAQQWLQHGINVFFEVNQHSKWNGKKKKFEKIKRDFKNE